VVPVTRCLVVLSPMVGTSSPEQRESHDGRLTTVQNPANKAVFSSARGFQLVIRSAPTQEIRGLFELLTNVDIGSSHLRNTINREVRSLLFRVG
jgi:hypothetical protein